jgi:hypothetical protein
MRARAIAVSPVYERPGRLSLIVTATLCKAGLAYARNRAARAGYFGELTGSRNQWRGCDLRRCKAVEHDGNRAGSLVQAWPGKAGLFNPVCKPGLSARAGQVRLRQPVQLRPADDAAGRSR